jgi:hypothetical protein
MLWLPCLAPTADRSGRLDPRQQFCHNLSALAPLVRRGRAIAHQGDTLTAGRYLVGGAYHFCWTHQSLRRLAPWGTGQKWQARTPAMAAGLTDHPWTMHELLRSQVPLPAWVPPKRRGRPPNTARPPLLAVASPRSSGVVPAVAIAAHISGKAPTA